MDGDDDYPYAVPLSFAYDDGRLYFHVAKSGHKLDALRRNPKASFCIIEQDKVVPEKICGEIEITDARKYGTLISACA